MKKLNLFNFNKPGKGITKAQAQMTDNDGLSGFFRMYKDRFWSLSSLNLLFIAANFPIFFAIAAFTGNFNLETTSPVSPLFAPFFGISQYGDTPFISSLFSVIGTNATMSVPSLTTNILWGLSLLIILTVGLSNTGVTYVLRGFVRSEPVYILSDFIDAVKKNFKQGLILGVLDCLFTFVLVYGIMTYYINAGTYMVNVMLFAEILLFILFLTMRFYMYMIMITFDLSIFKILKNSFIFALIGFKRNFVVWFATILIGIFSFYIFFAIPTLGVALPVIITITTLMFITAFTTYPVIKRYMIDPYYNDDGSKKNSSEESIFVDRG